MPSTLYVYPWLIATSISILAFYLFSIIDAGVLLLSSSVIIVLLTVYHTLRNHRSAKLMRIHTTSFTQLLLICVLVYVASVTSYFSALKFSLQEIYDHKNFYPLITKINQWRIKLIGPYLAEPVAKKMELTLSHYLSSDSIGVILALITGRKEYLHLAFGDLIRKNGISHLFALSGFHLSILIIVLRYIFDMIFSLAKRSIHKKVLDSSILGLVWFYCLWIGFIPSLYRAASMLSINTLQRHIDGRSHFIKCWFYSAVVLMMLYPPIMYAPGFILSMLALIGVMVGVKMSHMFGRYLPSLISVPFCIGLCANAMTLWFSFLVFGSSYPVGIFMSLLLTPLVSLIIVVSIVLLSLSGLQHIILFKFLLICISWFIDHSVNLILYLLRIGKRFIIIDTFQYAMLFYLIVLGFCISYCIIVKRRYGRIRDIWEVTHY